MIIESSPAAKSHEQTFISDLKPKNKFDMCLQDLDFIFAWLKQGKSPKIVSLRTNTRIFVMSMMNIAIEEARQAGIRGEVPVGALIVYEGKIIARDGNRSREKKDPTAHAEILVIRHACQILRSEKLTNCDLYSSLEPCGMCTAAISFARIRRLYYAASDPKNGSIENGFCFYSRQACYHIPEIYPNIGEKTAATLLLKKFFSDKRHL